MSFSRLLNWLPALSWAAVIWYLSSQPTPPSPVDLPDYVSHALEYGFLGGLVWRGMAGGFVVSRRGRWLPLWVVLLCAFYGLSDEIHQSFVPGRDSSALDLAADVVGAALAAGGLWLINLAAGAALGSRPAGMPSLTLLSRKDCHLCDEAESVLLQVQRELPFRYTKVDVDSDQELKARYGEEIPVVLMGRKKIFKYRIDPDRLRRKLQQAV